jgi:hypothetical protein
MAMNRFTPRSLTNNRQENLSGSPLAPVRSPALRRFRGLAKAEQGDCGTVPGSLPTHAPEWQLNWLAEPKLAQIYTRLRPKGLRRDNLRRFASEGWWRLSIPQRYKAP